MDYCSNSTIDKTNEKNRKKKKKEKKKRKKEKKNKVKEYFCIVIIRIKNAKIMNYLLMHTG